MMKCKGVKITDTDPSTSSEAIRTRIEQEISELQAALIACHSRYNSLSPISRLPPEILSGIFKVFAKNDLEVPTRIFWIGITHVCSDWRRIAMECPSLWGLNIPLHRPRWTTEMLKRSNSAPLTVKALFDPYHDSRRTNITTWGEILESLPRVQKLCIDVYPRSDPLYPSAVDDLTGAAPILEDLTVSSINSDRTRAISLPEDIFSGAEGAPRLRRLKLRWCNFSWQPVLLCRLTDLSIRELSPVYRISISHLISVLADIPNLKDVHLVSVLCPFTAVSTASTSTQTTLPRITHLQFEDTLPNCTGFFSGITFPETVTVNIRCSLPETEDSPSVLAVPLLLQDLLISLSQYCLPIHTLVPRTNSFEAFNIPCTHRQKSHNINNHCDHHSPLVKILHGPAIGSMTDMRLLPVQHLRALRANFIEMSSSYWIKTYGRLKLLKYIKSTDCNAPSFIEALFNGVVVLGCPNVSFTQRKNTAGRLKFRSLELLAIWQVDLDIECGGQRLVDALKTCLKERRRRGLALPKLELRWCENLRKQDVEDLKPLVKRLCTRSPHTIM